MVKFIKLFLLFWFLMIFVNVFSFNFDLNTTSIENSINRISDMVVIQNQKYIIIEKIERIVKYENKAIDDREIHEIANEIYTQNLKYENLNIDLICATITQESRWNSRELSQAGAKGLMQLMPYTASFLAEELGIKISSFEELYNSVINIKLGCKYLSLGVDFYGMEGGLVNYNAGPKWANHYKKTGEIVPLETQNYVPSIIGYYKEYQKL